MTALVLGALVPAFAQETTVTDHSAKTLSEMRYANLGPGVHLSSWFWPNAAEIYDPARAENFYADADLDLIKSLGFRHVRLQVVPELLLNEQNPDAPNDWGILYVDKAIDRILGRGLSLTVSLEAERAGSLDATKPFEDRLLHEPAFRDAFCRLWTSLARRWNNRDPDRLFFEPLSQPHYREAASWERLQAQFAQAVRAGAPHHTILLCGADTGTQSALKDLTPGEDLNVVYGAHLYDLAGPFCSQGNTRYSRFAGLAGIPYPASPKDVGSLVGSLRASGKTDIADLVEEYGDERWDSARMQEAVDSMAQWAQERRCRVFVSEFGAAPSAARADRIRYVRDVSAALNKARIPWSYWDYTSLFSTATKTSTNAAAARSVQDLDREMVQALGLQLPRKP